MVVTGKMLTTTALGAFYLWIAYAAEHPIVDGEYSAHFLRRTASCWVPKNARAESSLPGSLQFGEIGYPDACRYLRLGWWEPEHWGVWSNGDRAMLHLPPWPRAQAVDLTVRGSPEPGHTVRARFALGSEVVEKDIPSEGTTTVTLPLPQPGTGGDVRLTFSSYTVIPAISTKPGKPMTRHVGIGLVAMRPVDNGV